MYRLIVICCLGLTACATDPLRVPSTPKAVFMIVDGIPADVIETVATPNLDDVSRQGGYARAYVGGTVGEASESPTISAVGYASLLTGTWSNKHNVWDNDISAPNYAYWDIFHIAKAHDPALSTAIFSTWTDNRIKLLGDGRTIAGGDKFDYHFDGLELNVEQYPADEESLHIRAIDSQVASNAAAYIAAQGPNLAWVYLQYTDDVAHRYGDGLELATAVTFMDQQVGLILDAVRERQNKHNEDWLLIITTDHGRDAATGKDHGGQSERERTIWIATNSTRLNSRFQQTPAIVDILPSIATHLELKIPDAVAAQLDGRSFID